VIQLDGCLSSLEALEPVVQALNQAGYATRPTHQQVCACEKAQIDHV
jgi:hypothetical protein